ncbi:OmpA family protein [Massilia sp. RP-1-19]|uniref:OmpA family protein n=1 Tax=Massilia polaris TaxID=2728846 RepID=A0A848HQS8_9BURK|nr:flagellar motor protein MotB [Massilia polaris]NML63317.1 OmpA family protein [Massilia polaris]
MRVQKPHDKKHGDHAVFKRAGRKHEEDDHGGAWKVAFADFCLALMALFLVLWLMAAREQQSLKAVVQEMSSSFTDASGHKPSIGGGPRGSLIERFALPHHGESHSPDSAPRKMYDSPADLAELSKVLASMSADTGLSSNLEAVVMPYGLRVMLHDTEKQGMFMLGSAKPTERFVKLLRKMGPLFAKMENQMLMVGHTDSLKYADDPDGRSNWTLSTSRAMAARAQLMSGGMHAESVLQVVGMADRSPLDPSNTAASMNRRIELLILTRKQADSVAAMFGPRTKGEALSAEADVSITDRAELEQLRGTMTGAKAQ